MRLDLQSLLPLQNRVVQLGARSLPVSPEYARFADMQALLEQPGSSFGNEALQFQRCQQKGFCPLVSKMLQGAGGGGFSLEQDEVYQYVSKHLDVHSKKKYQETPGVQMEIVFQIQKSIAVSFQDKTQDHFSMLYPQMT